MADSTITARLGLESKAFQKGLAEAQGSARTFSKQLSENIGEAGGDAAKAFKRKFGVGDVFKSLLAGVGLFSSDKVAEQIARFFTGFTEQGEEAYKRIAEASTRLADLNIENMRRTLSDEQKYQLLLRDREKILKNVATEAPGLTDKLLVVGAALGRIGGKIGIGGLAVAGKAAEQQLQNRSDSRGLANQANSTQAQIDAGEKDKQAAELKDKIEAQKKDYEKRIADAAKNVLKASDDINDAKADRSKFTLEDLAGKNAESGTTLGNQAAQARKVQLLNEQAGDREKVGDVAGSQKLRGQADTIRGGLSLLKSDERKPFRVMEERLKEANDKLREIVEAQKGIFKSR